MSWLEDDDYSVLRENKLSAFIDYLKEVLEDFNMQIPPASADEATLQMHKARVDNLEHDYIFQSFFADDFLDRMLAWIVFLFSSNHAYGSGKGVPATPTIEWNQLAYLLDGGRYWNYGMSRPGLDDSRIGILLGDSHVGLPFTKFIVFLFRNILKAKSLNPWSDDHRPWHTADPKREWTADRILARMIAELAEQVDNGRLAADSSDISFDELTMILQGVFWWANSEEAASQR